MADSENVQKLRRGYEDFNREDFEAMLEFMAPDVVLGRTGGQEPVVGHDAIRQFVQPDAFDWIRFEPLEIRENGDKIFVRVRVRARGRTTGLEVDQIGFHIWTVRDDKAIRLDPAVDEAEGLAAAGLA